MEIETKSKTTTPPKRSTPEERQAMVARWQASGLTQKAFCAQQGINDKTFATWLKACRLNHKRKKLTSCSTTFAAITPTASPTSIAPIIVRLPSGYGRLEKRVAYVCADISWLADHKWLGLKSIGVVESRVERKGQVTQGKRYYISSLPANARQLNRAARAHWGIENRLHWRLDAVFNEDGACIRNDNAAENMDILRKWALNVLQKARTKPSQSIKSLMRKNAMSVKHLKESLMSAFHA